MVKETKSHVDETLRVASEALNAQTVLSKTDLGASVGFVAGDGNVAESPGGTFVVAAGTCSLRSPAV